MRASVKIVILTMATLLSLAWWRGLDALLHRQAPVPAISATGEQDMADKVKKTEKEWKKALTPEQLLLTRLKDMLDTRKLEHTTNAGADEIKVSQSDLATMVGVSRQTLSTLLARLVAKGRIEVGYRRIRLLP